MHLPSDSGIADRWRALWSASPQRSPFSRLDYLAAVAEAAGLGVHVHFVERSGRDTAAAAVTWRRRGPYREVIVPPCTPISAVVIRGVVRETEIHGGTSSLGLLLARLDRCYHAVRLHLPDTLSDVRPAIWRGWDVRPLYTYEFAIKPDVTSDWTKSTVKNFHSAVHDFELIEGNEAAAAAAPLVVASYRRSRRRPPLEESALAALVRRVQGEGLARAFGARHRKTGDIHAAVVALTEHTKGYYWLAGSFPGGAMTVLIGKMLPRLREAGVERFDMVGANTASIAEFKRRFGSRLQAYYGIEHYRRKDLKLLYTMGSIFR